MSRCTRVTEKLGVNEPFVAGCDPCGAETEAFERPIVEQLILAVDTFIANGTWTSIITGNVIVESWGAGGGGTTNTGGGGGGAYARSTVAVAPGNYAVVVGASGADANGGDSSFNTVTVVAKGGTRGGAGGAGGTAAASTGTTKFSGGNGELGINARAGGSGAGSEANGANGSGGGSVGGSKDGGWTTGNIATQLGGGGFSTVGAGNAGTRGEVRVIYDSMIGPGFPQVRARSNVRVAIATAAHAATLPSGIEVNDRLVIAVTVAANVTITVAGWNKIGQVTDATNSVTLALFEKVATGGDTATIAINVASQLTYQCWRIRQGGALTWSTATGNSTNVNAPNHAPGLTKYLWLVVGAWNSSPAGNITPPANYGAAIWTSGRIFLSPSLMCAERYLEAANENPGAFVSNMEEWAAATISIPYSP